jgi:hypothetical protein
VTDRPRCGIKNNNQFTPEYIFMSLGPILLILLFLLLIGAFPAWPHSKGWGYGPSGGVGLVVVIVLILVLTGRI